MRRVWADLTRAPVERLPPLPHRREMSDADYRAILLRLGPAGVLREIAIARHDRVPVKDRVRERFDALVATREGR